MDPENQPDSLYGEVNATYGSTVRRLARGYEADPERRRDLLQEIHIALWQSLKIFDRRCDLRTWVYRVANNVGASHIMRSLRSAARLMDLEALDTEPAVIDGYLQADRQYSAARILGLIHQLKPLDRQIILLYLEGEAAGPIAEATGLSASNVATKVHRIKKLLNRRYVAGRVMQEDERSPTPESVWKSIHEEEESNMDMTMTPDRLCAIARWRDRENVWAQRTVPVLLMVLAGFFAYNVYTMTRLWVRLGQVWMIGVLGFYFVKLVRQSPRRMKASESCASFLEREFEGSRSTLLEARRAIFLLVPAILARGGAAGRRFD